MYLRRFILHLKTGDKFIPLIRQKKKKIKSIKNFISNKLHNYRKINS